MICFEICRTFEQNQLNKGSWNTWLVLKVTDSSPEKMPASVPRVIT